MYNIHTCAQRMPHDLFHLCFLAVHIDLLIFPTRRSSDLGWRSCLAARLPNFLDLLQALFFLVGAHRRGRKRSEEHTSELQSRQYLVFRLVIEKKIFKLATSVCRITFHLLASLLVKLVV